MDPLHALLGVMKEVLRQAIPKVEGRVFLRRSTPSAIKGVPFIYVSLGPETVEVQDQAPLLAHRSRTISITPVVRGDTEESYEAALVLREQILAIMREIQFLPDSDPDVPLLIDQILPAGESELDIIDVGDKNYTGLSITYEVEYTTEEGSVGDSGPGVPNCNVVSLLQRVVTKWKAKHHTDEERHFLEILGETDGQDTDSEDPEAAGQEP